MSIPCRLCQQSVQFASTRQSNRMLIAVTVCSIVQDELSNTQQRVLPLQTSLSLRSAGQVLNWHANDIGSLFWSEGAIDMLPNCPRSALLGCVGQLCGNGDDVR